MLNDTVCRSQHNRTDSTTDRTTAYDVDSYCVGCFVYYASRDEELRAKCDQPIIFRIGDKNARVKKGTESSNRLSRDRGKSLTG